MGHYYTHWPLFIPIIFYKHLSEAVPLKYISKIILCVDWKYVLIFCKNILKQFLLFLIVLDKMHNRSKLIKNR